MKTPYDTALENIIASPNKKQDGYELYRLRLLREAYLAALQSPQVTALKTALKELADLSDKAGYLYGRNRSDQEDNAMRSYFAEAVYRSRATLAPWKEEANA